MTKAADLAALIGQRQRPRVRSAAVGGLQARGQSGVVAAFSFREFMSYTSAPLTMSLGSRTEKSAKDCTVMLVSGCHRLTFMLLSFMPAPVFSTTLMCSAHDVSRSAL